ncbi:hypothetical protein EXN66_Car012343 [Channa argus]|uniref:Uncharacterized protein n=1 Tax=Channa argus TaxID=215402 RepID=A0A6G1Q2B5_CHAAH|nr:hypothetical protein EXN66_Car012343 [Channa argus]
MTSLRTTPFRFSYLPSRNTNDLRRQDDDFEVSWNHNDVLFLLLLVAMTPD